MIKQIFKSEQNIIETQQTYSTYKHKINQVYIKRIPMKIEENVCVLGMKLDLF